MYPDPVTCHQPPWNPRSVFVCCNLIALSLLVSAYTHYYDRALHHCIGKIYPAGIIIMALGKVSQSRI